jgi:hypothetical protein
LAQRKRNISRRAALDSDALAWLRGDKSCGLYQFKPQDDLEAVWSEYGDADSMFWRRDMRKPITLEILEAFEDAWLCNDKDGMSFFIAKHYSDDEKQTLWAERGDKSLYRWSQGKRKPEAI